MVIYGSFYCPPVVRTCKNDTLDSDLGYERGCIFEHVVPLVHNIIIT